MEKFNGRIDCMIIIGHAAAFDTPQDAMDLAFLCGKAKKNNSSISIHPDALMRILEKANPLAKGDDK